MTPWMILLGCLLLVAFTIASHENEIKISKISYLVFTTSRTFTMIFLHLVIVSARLSHLKNKTIFITF
jgi:hypothetical protein